MARYEVRISRTAERQLRKLERSEQRRVAKTMLELGDEPRPRGSRKLSGFDDVFRIRVGRYRILYSIHGDTLIVSVLKIGHRRGVYR